MTDGWIGVDLDCTLCHFTDGQDLWTLGEPLAPMVERVKGWIAEGKDVRIFTARVAVTGHTTSQGNQDNEDFARGQRILIEEWCRVHLGCALSITATKDYEMLELWDDRCVQMIPNTGMSILQSQV